MAEFWTSFLHTAATLMVVLLVSFYLYVKSVYRYFKKRGIPYDPPVFPLGSLTRVAMQKKSFIMTLADIYERNKTRKLVGFFFLWRKQILINDLDIIKQILVKDFDAFEDRGVYHNKKIDPLSAHLFTIEGHEWKWLRGQLTPTVSASKLRVMFPLITQCAEQMLDYLNNTDSEQKIVESQSFLKKYGLSVVSNTAFGLESDAFTNEKSQFVVMANKMLEPTMERILKITLFLNVELATFLNIRVTPMSVQDFFTNLIKDAVRFRKHNNVVRNDYLQLLIQLREKETFEAKRIKEGVEEHNTFNFSDDDLSALAFMFVLGGSETTSMTLSLCLYELAQHEEIQQRLLTQLDALSDLSYDSVCGCEYLDMVISETLRKYPVLGFLIRVATRDYQVPGTDTVIEKGTQVLVSLQGLQHDPDLFPQPDLFNPERFSKENINNIQPYSYMPFGEGPRVCIGVRFAKVTVKIALVLLLRQFLVRLSPSTPVPFTVEPRTLLTSAAGGLWLTFERRTDTSRQGSRVD